MNAQSIVNRVNRRLPGYDLQNEILDEVNDAYQECWDAVCQLDDSYFTDIKTVTTAQSNPTSEFDFLYNSNGGLVLPLSYRYFQIDRIRVLQPGDTSWVPASPRPWNDPQFQTMSQMTPQQIQTNPPYLYNLLGRGSVKFANAFGAGVQFEVVYSFVFLPLVILAGGTISNASTVVTGTGTNFTQMVSPDNVAALLFSDLDAEVGIEIIVNGQTYVVTEITSDTQLLTLTAIAPSVSATAYQLASVPDIPYGFHDTIATLATRNAMSTPGNDPRLPYWTARAKVALDSMRDGIMTRQRQEPPRRRRFSQSVLRYNVPNISR